MHYRLFFWSLFLDCLWVACLEQCCELWDLSRQDRWLWKLQTLGTWCHGMVSFPALGLIEVWLKKAIVPESSGMGFGAKQSKHLVSELAELYWCLCTYAEEWGCERSPALFCTWRGNTTSHRCTPIEKSISPCTMGYPQVVSSALGLLACLLSKSRAVPSGHWNVQVKGPPILNPIGSKN